MQRHRLALAVAVIAAFLAVASALTLLVSGPGSRLGLWHFRTGFVLLRLAGEGGLGAVVLGAAALALGRPTLGWRSAGLCAVALLLGFASFWVPSSWARQAKRLPMIHDITTDPVNPPEFSAVLPLRADAPNSAQYGGPEVAREQARAYPDIRSLVLPLSKDRSFQRALEVARASGWQIVAADPARGTIEATDTTFWFGFKDDVAVRIVPAADGRSVVDARSVSRVGRSDVGTNARRLRTYLAKLRGTR